MLGKSIARSLMGIVPDRVAATVILTPDGVSPTTVSIYNAWLKPMDVRLQAYGGVNLQGNETRIKIPDHELNPASNGREMRPQDTIEIADVVYIVITARLMSVRTVWECVVRKEMA